jgi:pimeloyl-ACP methyl ester carboxylesterase
MCEDVLNYIDANNIDKPIILGHSLGGKVAMKFAFTYAERIAKLIVADIAPRRYNTDFHENLLLNISRINLRNFNTRNDVEKELSLVINNSDVRLFLLKNLYRNENMELGWRFNIKILLSKVRNIQDDSFVRGVCNVPTHFIRGENSDYINPSDEIIIKNHFSNYSILTIKDSGHWLHAEQPDIFFNEVTSCCLR